jgi:hypothetical protein
MIHIMAELARDFGGMRAVPSGRPGSTQRCAGNVVRGDDFAQCVEYRRRDGADRFFLFAAIDRVASPTNAFE